LTKEKRIENVQAQPLGTSLRLTLIAISAALYAAAIGATAPISTPWGVGQFRPGVVFPSIFAVLYGPLVGGIGAAIGTFIGDVVFGGGWTNALLSLVAGVPGNFIGFYLLGWFVRKYRSWNGFVFGSFLALFVGNLVAASGVVAYLVFIVRLWSFPVDTLVGATLGFTFFWLVTMIPFVIPLVPPLVRAIQPLVGAQANVGVSGWKRGSGSEAIRSSVVISAILGILYLLVQFTPLGDSLFTLVVAGPQFIPWLKLLFLVAAIVVLVFGIVANILLRPDRKVSNSR
jgi:hypothetical protein